MCASATPCLLYVRNSDLTGDLQLAVNIGYEERPRRQTIATCTYDSPLLLARPHGLPRAPVSPSLPEVDSMAWIHIFHHVRDLLQIDRRTHGGVRVCVVLVIVLGAIFPQVLWSPPWHWLHVRAMHGGVQYRPPIPRRVNLGRRTN